jgi:2'-5' RNA ligase
MRRLERPGRGQLVLAGNSISAKVHNETVGGIEYLVAPAVLLREDVLNDEMVLADEIAAHFKAWNGRPVVVAHPEANGVKVSANDPAILAQQQVGKLFAAAFDGGKLRGELWIEVAKTKTVPGGLETLRRLRSSTPTEISTAYFRDKEMTAGTWGGKDYESIARNLRPDHVAVLLDTKGACNWEDGCGVPRVNEEDAVWGMIALTLPPNVVNEVAVEGGESPEDLHLTIALFKDAQPDLVFDAAKNLALDHSPLTGKINGVGRFSETHKDDGATAFYVNFDSSELPDFRQAVGDSLEAAGIKLEENHGFTPHVTLAYLAPDDPLPFENVLIEDVTLPSISAHCGDEHKVYKLEGKPMKDNETTVEANEKTRAVYCVR